jgi:membrane-bound lytic murein transglycosylase D
MADQRNAKLLIGASLMAMASMLTAYQAVRPMPGAEPAPMQVLLKNEDATASWSPGAEAVTVSAERSMGSATWDLPVTRNERVDQWISFLKGRNADKTRVWLERSGRYTPMIREALRERGMPEDLIYLAFIESGFSPRAYSPAAAAGIWQFIAETGRRYGLEVSSYVDERRDPIASTDAALDYLEELHGRFGSWYLAAAAYNTGENRVARILRERTGGASGRDDLFWRIAPYLPQETRNYVPLMLAAGHIGKNPQGYGFDAVEYHAPLAFDTAYVPGQTSLELIAKAAGVPTDAVKDLNPHLMRGTTPPGRSWYVRIPRGTVTAFGQNFDVVQYAERANERQRIALAQTERSTKVSTSKATTVASKSKSSSKGKLKIHVVRRGENLSSIADRYDVSVGKVQSLNGLRTRNRIYPGQKLRVS